MENKLVYYPSEWPSYEFIDSGQGEKLERFGKYLLLRDEPSAWWQKSAPEEVWQTADAVRKSGLNPGTWVFRQQIPPDWILDFEGLKIKIKLSNLSKHLGIFPEEAGKWRWVEASLRAASQKKPRVLNLFGYTGISTLIAARVGALVTHVDGSRPSILWAKENQRLSGLENLSIRWILDDALKFVRRECRRNAKYEAIILDPPTFGRGPKKEIWKIKEDLVSLLEILQKLLSPEAVFIILTTYGLGEPPLLLQNLLSDITIGGALERGEFILIPKFGVKPLPMSAFACWAN